MLYGMAVRKMYGIEKSLLFWLLNVLNGCDMLKLGQHNLCLGGNLEDVHLCTEVLVDNVQWLGDYLFMFVVCQILTHRSTQVNNNGLFDFAATAGLETQSTYILHTDHKKI